VTTPRVWVGGQLVPAEQARISALDLGFRSGVGLFETFRVDGSCTFRLDDHLARLQDGARHLGFDLSPHLLHTAVAATVHANLPLGPHLAVRITCSPGPIEATAPFPGRLAGDTTIVVTAQPTAPLPARPSTATATLTALRREVATLKHSSYLVAVLAQRAAAAAGVSDALCTDPAGAPLEGATANLLVLHDEVLTTAPASAGILAGITRDAVLRLATAHGLTIRERVVDTEELAQADEAMLTSAVGGVRPLVEVDGNSIGTGRAGPVVTALAEAYLQLRRRDAVPLPLSPPRAD